MEQRDARHARAASQPWYGTLMTKSRSVQALIAASIAGCVGVTGCTSGSSGGSNVVGSGKTLAQQLAEAFCAREASCCGNAADGGAAVPCRADASAPASADASAPASADAGTGSTCEARAELTATEQLALVSTAYGEGLLTVSALTTSSCVAAYQASCAGTGTALNVDEALSGTACAGLFIGYIPVGERCDMTAECISGSFCLSQETGQPITSLLGAGTLGVCFPYQRAGDACNKTADCLPPLTCSPSTLVCQ